MKSTLRQDGWTQEEDQTLKEMVLDHIRNGRTQLTAFAQAAAKMGRSPAACGFRWNAALRKTSTGEIEMAKQKRKENQLQNTTRKIEEQSFANPTQTLLNWGQIMRFLRNEKDTLQYWMGQYKQKNKECEEWKSTCKELYQSVDTVQKQYRELKTEYDQLQPLIEKMRISKAKQELGKDYIPESEGAEELYQIDEQGYIQRGISS